MHEQSVFAATYVAGPEDYEGNGWVYPGCCTYTADFVQQLAAECGLVCTPVDWMHPNGQQWVVFTLAGQEPNFPALTDQSRVAYLEIELERAHARIMRLEEGSMRKIQRNLKRVFRRLLKRRS